jgi:hypothetical protein
MYRFAGTNVGTVGDENDEAGQSEHLARLAGFSG